MKAQHLVGLPPLICALSAGGARIAIWMPSDTARVREACGGKSQ